MVLGTLVATSTLTLLAGCGRIGFEDLGSTDAPSTSDVGIVGAPFTIDLPLSGIAGIAMLPGGGVAVVGGARGPITVGGRVLSGNGDFDVLLAAIEPDGTVRWAKLIGGADYDSGEAIATAQDGTIYITGQFFGAADLGGGVLVGNGNDAFVASFTPNGDHLWSFGFGGNDLSTIYDTDDGTSIALAPNGDIVVGGSVARIVDFGDGTNTPASTARSDGFVARYSADGTNLRWARRWGVVEENAVTGVAVDVDGTAYASGYYSGAADFGSGPVTNRGALDAFVVALSSTGAHLWDRNFGGPDTQRLWGLRVLGTTVVGAGYYWQTIDLPVAASSGKSDGLVVGYSTTGTFAFATRFGGAGCEFARGINLLEGELMVSGAFEGTIDLGNGPRTAIGGTDSLLFVPSAGTVSWSAGFGSTSDDKSTAAAGSRANGLYAVGHRNLTFDANCNENNHSGYITRF